ncbi:hypothetical protein P152DRAFT_90115 [Eremomyces bilateralis CBS 781.70]|uniref:Protein SQS1 n=1 Tax=Eremomyces bilateralis CBS 781.70 TaxID=1392243 RepID=A0A6G1FXW6_9PEZI|nr:uncharacterized protein P152DRAFT_90115 [Eremomyces bilateralis CBS 781.70]KAF1810598.1 hypothetical protein P152DRAFT_90115 [Eremomyces bilateralis CBS 781.70]
MAADEKHARSKHGKPARSPSPASSSGSEEIVFEGRCPPSPTPSVKALRKLAPHKRNKLNDEWDVMNHLERWEHRSKPGIGWNKKKSDLYHPKTGKRVNPRDLLQNTDMLAEFEAMEQEKANRKAVVDDYVENMDADDLAYMMGQSNFASRDIDNHNGNQDVFYMPDSDSDVNKTQGVPDLSGDVRSTHRPNVDGTASINGTASVKGKAKVIVDSDPDEPEESDDESDTAHSETIDDEEIARRLQAAEFTSAKTGDVYDDFDDIDDFDITDFNRPSLGNKKKSKGFPGYQGMIDLADDEMVEEMQSAWANDRMKKKARKQERERLRAEGLLGSKSKKAKAAADKVIIRKTITEIRDEIRSFIRSGDESYAFSPMTPDQRRNVHLYAHHLQLVSKSIGGGNKRFTILKKTAHSLSISERQMDRVLGRPIGPKSIKRDRAGPSKDSTNVRAGAPTTYGHGEVIGADAPEIGTESKGHAMLRKMGWDKGKALGAENTGILEPIEQIMRRNRRGLG